VRLVAAYVLHLSQSAAGGESAGGAQ
jgi:hypothetical protein